MSNVYPFREGESIAELGGNPNNPLFRPNVNAVAGAGVDYVADLNGSIPLPDASYDGIYASYVLEHLRHVNVRGFLKEVHRVLKPGGRAVMITANLLEQAKRLVEKQDWDDDDIHMVFGGKPDEVHNYHHTGFSPKSATVFCDEAGFSKTEVYAHPHCITDMVVIVWK